MQLAKFMLPHLGQQMMATRMKIMMKMRTITSNKNPSPNLWRGVLSLMLGYRLVACRACQRQRKGYGQRTRDGGEVDNRLSCHTVNSIHRQRDLEQVTLCIAVRANIITAIEGVRHAAANQRRAFHTNRVILVYSFKRDTLSI